MTAAGRRVVVTGLGVVCATGGDVDAFWRAAVDGRPAIERRTISAGDGLDVTVPMAAIDGAARAAVNAASADFPPALKRADPFSRYAAVAADEAVRNAGFADALARDGSLAARTATIIGSGIGGQLAMDEAYVGILRKGRRAHPLTILKTIPNAAASQVSIRYGLQGPAFAISSACASGAHAIGVAGDLIRSGGADAAIAGASEMVLTFGALEAWKAMHILADETCRPFSKNRNGLVIGEGAGVLMLEERERARRRGAPILAELVGFGMNADGSDMINPAVEGAAGALSLALDGLRVDAAATYVNAHGTGTLLNDPTETQAIRKVFGADADKLAVSSTKSMHGHLLGAAGGVEAAIAIRALTESVAPPTANYDEPDPACDLDVTPNDARERAFDTAISNSFAFGGLNAVLAFAKA
ncbi:MAG: beta-ketoacyl-[acyl-carrier-protein] synthase family protein [Parvularculaceae bacterium]